MGHGLRIAQLANFVGPASGGMKTAMRAIGRGYVAAGADRLVVMPGPRDAREMTDAGEIVQLRAPRVGGGYRLIVEPWRVTEVLEEFDPTSVEVSDKSTLLPISRWARKNGVGSVLFSHEHLDAMLSLRTGLDTSVSATIGVWNRILMRSFDSIVVTSRFAESEFAAAALRAGTPIRRIPLGVDLETFRPATATPRCDDPTRLDRMVRLVHFGRLSREKSPHLAVAAAVELHRRGLPVRLDVYGDGPQREDLEALAGSAPVFFHGHIASRERLARLVAAADVSISACPGETFGLSALEALACGTPVVTADVGGASELISADSGAWGSPDAVGIATAVERVLAMDPVGRRSAARRRAEQFPWTTCVDALLDVHRSWAPRSVVRTA
jgi:alpha-1,6-mannosyltransferase